MKKTPKEELYRRVKALQGRMVAEGIDGALIVQNADLFYFTGTVQQAYLFVPPGGEPLFFVRKDGERIRNVSALNRIITVENPRDLPELLAANGYPRINRLGMELDILPVNIYLKYLDTIKPAEIIDIWPSIQAVRAVKSDYEIGLLKEAALLSDFMVAVGRENIREGITDIELVAKVEAAARARGHQGFVRMRAFNQEIYWGHLISGPDAAEPSFILSPTGGHGLSNAFPQGAGRHVIGRHEPVIFDLVAALHGYYVDQTRTLSLGSLPGKLADACKVALEIQNKMGEMIRPGILLEELFSVAQQTAESRRLGEHFMGYGNQRVAFCGHGIGLELDEFPVITKGEKTPLCPGMVIVLEPKFHFPGEGVVGVEDTFVVTDKGNEKITNASYEVEVIQ